MLRYEIQGMISHMNVPSYMRFAHMNCQDLITLYYTTILYTLKYRMNRLSKWAHAKIIWG